jgi:L-ascorbate metabolism protein UlaG (beta-lactamase superfamily)
MAVAARRLTTAVEVRLVYVGHATVLIEFPWMRVLTDPFFGLRLGPLRRHGPEPDLEAIGSVVIVLSWNAHPYQYDRLSLSLLDGTPLVGVPAGL